LKAEVWKEIEILESSLDPADAGTYWTRLVELYRASADESKDDPERCFALLCNTSDVYIEKLNDTNAAFEVLKENQIVNPKDERNLDKLESLAEKNDAWQALANHYQDVLDETFDMEVAVMLHRRRGRILQEKLDRPEAAAEHFWQIIQLDSSDARAYESLISYYESARKWNELVNLLERRLDNTSNEDEKCAVLMRIGETWEKEISNRYEAKDWYTQVLALRPNDEAASAALKRLTEEDSSRTAESALREDEDLTEDDEDMQALISIHPPTAQETEEAPSPSGEEDGEGSLSDTEDDVNNGEENGEGSLSDTEDDVNNSEADGVGETPTSDSEAEEEPDEDSAAEDEKEDSPDADEAADEHPLKEDSPDADEAADEHPLEEEDSIPPPPAAAMPEQSDAPWPVEAQSPLDSEKADTDELSADADADADDSLREEDDKP
jgi:tetratricopeptide (TPR) repeat protein